MQRIGALTLHGTVTSYDTLTGAFTAFMDFQQPGAPPYTFTPRLAEETDNLYADQFQAAWRLIRS